MNIVLDSSVIAKWYFKEENFQKARQILETHRLHLAQITVPVLLFFEIGNIFINKKIAARDKFARNIQDLYDVNLTVIEINDLLLQLTFAIAAKYKLSFYDATYVATAESLKCDFITADEKLVEKTKKLKFVKLLGQS